jgi:hypothetical protein
VNDIDDYVELLCTGLNLPVTVTDMDIPMDEITDWDSVHLLWLLTVMEERTGRRVPLPAVLEATSLGGIYALYANS